MSTRSVIAALVVLLAATIASSDDLARPSISLECKRAVLMEDWSRVAELLVDVGPNTPSPILRLIKGHACLALNRNNESLELFASALDEGSKQQWQDWVNDFVEVKGESSISWYLKGDAYARRRSWDSASQSFDRALELDSGCYLALNARGVATHAVGNTIMARTYFAKAAKAKEDFADAYASRGTLNVWLYSASDKEDFERARSYSADDNPVVALIGLGCVEYGSGDYAHAQEYFGAAPQGTSLEMLIRRNQLATELALLDQCVRDAKAVGTTIESFQIEDEEGGTGVEISDLPEGVLFSLVPEGWEIWVGIPGVIGGRITGTFEPEDEGNEGEEGGTTEEGGEKGEGEEGGTTEEGGEKGEGEEGGTTEDASVSPPSKTTLLPELPSGVLFTAVGASEQDSRRSSMVIDPTEPRQEYYPPLPPEIEELLNGPLMEVVAETRRHVEEQVKQMFFRSEDESYIQSDEGQAEIERIRRWLEEHPDRWRTETGRRYIEILKELGLWDEDDMTNESDEKGEDGKASTSTTALTGGADSDPSNVMRNRGQWPVMGVYGLLYAIQ